MERVRRIAGGDRQCQLRRGVSGVLHWPTGRVPRGFCSWSLLAVTVAACAGCGGTDSRQPTGGDSVVLVRLRIQNQLGEAPTRIEVREDGATEVTNVDTWVSSGEPLGWFGTTLSGARLRALKAAVDRAAHAGLKEQYGYPQGSWPWEGPWLYWIDLPSEGGSRTVEFPGRTDAMPEALRPLCAEEDGLLIRHLREAMRRPTSAVVLALRLGKSSYTVSEPLDARLVVRAVGTEPVAFASVRCREVVAGGLGLIGRTATHREVIREGFAFGGRPFEPRLPALTEAARADLDHVLILEPEQEYVPPFPRSTVILTHPVHHRLGAVVTVEARYDLDALSEALSAPLISGTMWDWAEIDVHRP